MSWIIFLAVGLSVLGHASASSDSLGKEGGEGQRSERHVCMMQRRGFKMIFGGHIVVATYECVPRRNCDLLCTTV